MNTTPVINSTPRSAALALNSIRKSMKAKNMTKTTLSLAAAFFAATPASEAAPINVDINATTGPVPASNYTGAAANGPLASDNTWNYFTTAGTAGSSITVGGLTFTLGSGWNSYGDGAPNNLQGDRIYTTTSATITISGLDTTKDYNLALITGVNASGFFASDYTIGATTLVASAAAGAGTNANGPLTFANGVTHALFSGLDGSSGSITVTTSYTGPAGGAAILAGLQIEEAGADVSPPNITTLNPADNASVGVAVGTNLVASFNEEVQAGTSGAITLWKNLDPGPDELVETFDVTSSLLLTFGGNSVTIDPTADMVGGVEYYVLIDADAIVDTASNGFAGISGIGDWSFTPDATPPAVGTLDSPANGATGVSPAGGLALTFDEDIQKGSGNVVIKRIADGMVVDTIDVATANVTVSGGQVTIMPTAILPSLTELYVEIDTGAFLDLANNSFAGISGSGTWSFTTAEIVLFDDFSSDPNISTDWTQHAYFSSPPAGVATWNSTDQDLDLVKPTSVGPGWGVGVFRTGSTRSATDAVTMTVGDFSSSGGGSWGFLGLMISAVANPGYTTTTDDTYMLGLAALGGTDVRYEVRRTYLDGTSNFILYQGASFDLATSAPVTLDIVRNGDHYEFLANDVLLYTTASPAAGDTYDTAAKDSLVNYQIVMAGDRALNATVDDFGVGGATSSPYDTWAAQIADTNQRGRGDDPDGDGYINGEEFLFGSSPVAGNGSLVTSTTSGGNLVLRWLQRESGATYTLQQSATLEALSWTTAAQSPALDGDQTGAPTNYDYYTVSIPVGSGKLFYRIMGVEN